MVASFLLPREKARQETQLVFWAGRYPNARKRQTQNTPPAVLAAPYSNRRDGEEPKGHRKKATNSK